MTVISSGRTSSGRYNEVVPLIRWPLSEVSLYNAFNSSSCIFYVFMNSKYVRRIAAVYTFERLSHGPMLRISHVLFL